MASPCCSLVTSHTRARRHSAKDGTCEAPRPFWNFWSTCSWSRERTLAGRLLDECRTCSQSLHIVRDQSHARQAQQCADRDQKSHPSVFLVLSLASWRIRRVSHAQMGREVTGRKALNRPVCEDSIRASRYSGTGNLKFESLVLYCLTTLIAYKFSAIEEKFHAPLLSCRASAKCEDGPGKEIPSSKGDHPVPLQHIPDMLLHFLKAHE